MQTLKKKSLLEIRGEKNLPKEIEQEITDMELDNMERDIAITDNELAILELQQKMS